MDRTTDKPNPSVLPHSSAQARAAAKINLFLAVRGRRTDGYHDIETVFLPLPELYDTITVEDFKQGEIAIATDHPGLATDRSNLCWQAAHAFAESAGLTPAWRIMIDKRIPIAAGLGGGSADAGATLRLLNQRYGLPLSKHRLKQTAGRLGADVPFFLCPRVSLAGGIGDQTEELTLNCDIPLILLNPGQAPLTAAWAYSTVRNEFDQQSAKPLVEAMRAGDLKGIANNTYNRFDREVCRKMPLAALLVDFLTRQDCLAAHVSGSGPTVYGICRDSEQAGQIADAAKRHFDQSIWTWHGVAQAQTYSHD